MSVVKFQESISQAHPLCVRGQDSDSQGPGDEVESERHSEPHAPSIAGTQVLDLLKQTDPSVLKSERNSDRSEVIYLPSSGGSQNSFSLTLSFYS